MGKRVLTAALAGVAFILAAPAAAQGQPGPEVPVTIAAIPGVVAAGAQWRTFWEGPMIVDGMVHGGIAQGVAQALWEEAVYDADSGQLVSGSMMDYALPKADMLPFYETDRTETPTPVNPLGVKGAGETGTIASTPAVVNAVVDALSGLGVDHIEAMPLTPERVWKTAQAAKSRK